MTAWARGRHFVLPCVILLGVLIIYTRTVCPTVPGGDSGELIAVAHTLGVAHPPGYPLFTLLGHLADRLLWFGEPALRINLVSAFFGAVSSALVFVLCRRMTGSICASLLAVALFAFSSVVWTCANVAEVFTLNTALCLAAVHFAGQWREGACVSTSIGADDRRLFAAGATGMCLGLAMTNHHTALFVVLAIAITVLIDCLRGRIRSVPWKPAASVAIAGLLLALTLYLYLPLAATGNSPVIWGEPNSIHGFLRHVFRGDYGTLRLVSSGVEDKTLPLFAHPLLFLGTLAKDTVYVGMALGLLGILGLMRRHKAAARTSADAPGPGLPCLLSFLGSSLVFLWLVNAPLDPPIFRGVVARFYILPIAFFAVLAGYGLETWLAMVRHRRMRTTLRVAACLIAPAGMIVLHHDKADQSRNLVVRDLGTNILRSLPTNALLFSRSDLVTNALSYQQYVLQERNDVVVLDQELLTYEWYVRHVRSRHPDVEIPGVRYDGVKVLNVDLIRANEGRRPIFFFGFKENSYLKAYVDEPHGLVRRIVPNRLSSTPGHLLEVNERILATFETRTLANPPRDQTTFEYEAMGHYGEFLFQMGRLAAKAGKREMADEYLRRALTIAPDHPHNAYGLSRPTTEPK